MLPQKASLWNLDIKAIIILEARLQLFELNRFILNFSVFTLKFLTAAICGWNNS